MKLVVLASGTGSRLMPLTKDRPKCMVEVNKKMIIDYLRPAFESFDQIICVTGYKDFLLRHHLSGVINIQFAHNEFYRNKNMVYSLFCAAPLIDCDIIVTYSDIIYDLEILKELINCKNTTIPIKKNWLDVWERRMPHDCIKKDAENLEIKDGKLLSIGGDILEKMPEFQYMGIIKINFPDFMVMKKQFFLLDDDTQSKIDMTSFLNYLVKEKLVAFDVLKTLREWSEIDSVSDIDSI
jgi:choline kinase